MIIIKEKNKPSCVKLLTLIKPKASLDYWSANGTLRTLVLTMGGVLKGLFAMVYPEHRLSYKDNGVCFFIAVALEMF